MSNYDLDGYPYPIYSRKNVRFSKMNFEAMRNRLLIVECEDCGAQQGEHCKGVGIKKNVIGHRTRQKAMLHMLSFLTRIVED